MSNVNAKCGSTTGFLSFTSPECVELIRILLHQIPPCQASYRIFIVNGLDLWLVCQVHNLLPQNWNGTPDLHPENNYTSQNGDFMQTQRSKHGPLTRFHWMNHVPLYWALDVPFLQHTKGSKNTTFWSITDVERRNNFTWQIWNCGSPEELTEICKQT